MIGDHRCHAALSFSTTWQQKTVNVHQSSCCNNCKWRVQALILHAVVPTNRYGWLTYLFRTLMKLIGCATARCRVCSSQYTISTRQQKLHHSGVVQAPFNSTQHTRFQGSTRPTHASTEHFLSNAHGTVPTGHRTGLSPEYKVCSCTVMQLPLAFWALSAPNPRYKHRTPVGQRKINCQPKFPRPEPG